VHRDLKPANICITSRSDGREVAKVIDFGVAKLRDGVDLSEEGTLIGTVGYMAPEQLTDHRQLDARADIYALGVILYQCLAGRPPHLCGRSELLFRIVSVDPRPLSELCPDLSPGLSEVVQRALARNKERRYPSARELARALEPYAEDAPSAPATVPERRSVPRKRLGADLGNAPTELESSPTWVALTPPHRADPRADRQCERESSPDATQGLDPEFCRQPRGFVTAAPAPTREQHLTKRALVLSVGALALSVVAMTTMFVFVYSHGESALEVRAAQRPTALLANGRWPLPTGPWAPEPSAGAPEPPAVRLCPKPTSPLAPASVLERVPGAGEPGVVVQALREAHAQANESGLSTPSLGPDGLPCE
jgi:serine/threonine-protein kinase